jgi:hypothetical protein
MKEYHYSNIQKEMQNTIFEGRFVNFLFIYFKIILLGKLGYNMIDLEKGEFICPLCRRIG